MVHMAWDVSFPHTDQRWTSHVPHISTMAAIADTLTFLSLTRQWFIIQMGYDFGVYLPGGWQTAPTATADESDVIYSNVNCHGDESTIWGCEMDVIVNASSSSRRLSEDECDSFERSVAVYCSRFC